MRIYLIGLPGVGKSTIGKKLAEKIEYRFLDLDSYIEQKAMLFVDEIFKLYGEEYFRALETNTLCEISKLDDVVISCGGGIVKSPKNKDYILGPCIYLKADIVQIEERLRESQIERPLLTTKTVLDLYKERKTLYEDFATLEVENTDVEETIHLILKEIDV